MLATCFESSLSLTGDFFIAVKDIEAAVMLPGALLYGRLEVVTSKKIVVGFKVAFSFIDVLCWNNAEAVLTVLSGKPEVKTVAWKSREMSVVWVIS